MIKHVIVKNTQLSKIAVCTDFPIEGGEKQAVAVIQGGVCCIFGASGEIHAEKSVEIKLGGVSLTVGGVEQLHLTDI